MLKVRDYLAATSGCCRGSKVAILLPSHLQSTKRALDKVGTQRAGKHETGRRKRCSHGVKERMAFLLLFLLFNFIMVPYSYTHSTDSPRSLPTIVYANRPRSNYDHNDSLSPF